MKRSVIAVLAVSVLLATAAAAQQAAPADTTGAATQDTTGVAPADTTGATPPDTTGVTPADTTGAAAQPPTSTRTAPPDTTHYLERGDTTSETAAQPPRRPIRRRKQPASRLAYTASIGTGTAFPFNPNEFDTEYNPSLGLVVDLGVEKGMIGLAAHFDYSFYLAQGIITTIPADANVLTAFLDLKIKPLNTQAHPYLVVGGGLFRYWVVEQNLYDTVLGFGGGAGVEIEIDKHRRVFVEARSVQGRTRKQARKANTEIIPVRAGITFVF